MRLKLFPPGTPCVSGAHSFVGLPMLANCPNIDRVLCLSKIGKQKFRHRCAKTTGAKRIFELFLQVFLKFLSMRGGFKPHFLRNRHDFDKLPDISGCMRNFVCAAKVPECAVSGCFFAAFSGDFRHEFDNQDGAKHQGAADIADR